MYPEFLVVLPRGEESAESEEVGGVDDVDADGSGPLHNGEDVRHKRHRGHHNR